ncbi:hypothetical protein M011DRAFT_469657 [Sporormia fimetaria CBS 119925]|uniref:Uncharacterized protein n=1 Tax=Sporormia fimetaria CBS 119925 TaxID=1340428 RepID=A0A6A6V7J1_9PLEO|nr:hypothetical protein M011DRAFT_469657 [Sporormia fimetaria CBS 119925]
MEMYVAHFTRKYCDKIRAGFIGLDNIAIIEKNTDANDSLFDCLCNNLALSRLRKTIPEPEKFEEFCRQHPYLAERVRRIESRLSRGRSGSLTGVKKPQT